MLAQAARYFFNDIPFGPTVFHDIEANVIKSREMTRLCEIKQLSTVYLFYPSATHTRYQHCCGVASLVKLYLESLPLADISAIDMEDRTALVLAGLLHDVGHSAWSHVGEEFSKFHGNEIKHERISHDLVIGKTDYDGYFSSWEKLQPVRKIIRSEGLRRKVANLVMGKPPIAYHVSPQEEAKQASEKAWMGKLIHGDLDFDRADYLRRDSFFTLGLSVISDPVTIARNTLVYKTLQQNELVFSNAVFAEGFILAIELMYPAIYVEPVNYITEEVLQRAFLSIYPKGSDIYEFWFSTDEQVIEKLRSVGNTDVIVQRALESIKCRRFYDLAAVIPFSEIKDKSLQDRLFEIGQDKTKLLRFEETLLDRATSKGMSLMRGDVVVGVYAKKSPAGGSANVLGNRGNVTTLNLESHLLDQLSTRSYLSSRSKLIVGTYPVLSKKSKQKLERLAIESIEIV